MNLVDGMKVFLASNFTLYLKTHGAHLNVTGMFFQSLHALFEEQYTDLQEQTDAIAEKIRELDHFAPASLAAYQKTTVIDDFDGVMDAKGYLEAHAGQRAHDHVPQQAVRHCRGCQQPSHHELHRRALGPTRQEPLEAAHQPQRLPRLI